MRHADRPTFDEQITVAAPPEAIWPLVSDPAFLVGPTEELKAAEWVDPDGDTPQVGWKFVGTNANKYFGEWQTTSTVVECDAPHVFAWAVGDLSEPNTCWRFSLEPTDDGTVVTQSGRLGVGESGLHQAIRDAPDKEERIVARRIEQFRASMRATLDAVKRVAESA